MKIPVDEVPSEACARLQWLKRWYFEIQWYEAYNFIEFIVKNGNATFFL